MPSYLLRWWNAQVAGHAKSVNCLNHLHTLTPAVAPMTPPVPAQNQWSIVCEAMGGTSGFSSPDNGTIRNGIGGITRDAANPTRWYAVRNRQKKSERQHQYGYMGTPVPPAGGNLSIRRLDKSYKRAWPNRDIATWDSDYPVRLPHIRGTSTYLRPLSSRVRKYKARREIVHSNEDPLHVFWYHAISGGNSTGMYDLLDALALMIDTVDDSAGGNSIGLLMGDLNMVPARLKHVLDTNIDNFPVPVAPINTGHNTLYRGQLGILSTGAPTHFGKTPRELDYAIVYVGPGYPAASAARSIILHDMPRPVAPRSDHCPIVVQINF